MNRELVLLSWALEDLKVAERDLANAHSNANKAWTKRMEDEHAAALETVMYRIGKVK